ncbi:MAG: hypothetical protein AB9919_05190 [Geobacteraceae bacterium]|jgi:hypothetical protein
MRKIAKYLSGIAAAFLVAVTFASAATNTPIKSSIDVKPGSVLHIGDQASFLYNGTEGVKQVICAGETIPVFKETNILGLTKRTEMGAVKVLSYTGDHRFMAQVVEGQLSNGDIAFKESATCMLYHPES